MKNKFNKLYSIFYNNVVVSDSILINAIQGYNIEDRGFTATLDDLSAALTPHYRKCSYIPTDRLIHFSNPASNVDWYIGNHIVACGVDGKAADIKLLFNERTVIVKDLKYFNCFKKVLGMKDTYGIIMIPIIGKLSYPDTAHVQFSPKTANIQVKLPIVI